MCLLQVVDIDEVNVDAAFERKIWDHHGRPKLHNYMRCLVGVCDSAGDGRTRTGLQEFVDDCWFNASLAERKQTLIEDFGAEASLALLLDCDSHSEAKEMLKKLFDSFLQAWSSSDSIGRVAKLSRLRSLQRLVELNEYVTTVEGGKGSLSQQELIHVWGSRLPTRHDTDADSWDYILTSRLALTRKFPQNLEVSSSAAKLYLSMSKVARRQGSLDVAEVYLQNAKKHGGTGLRCSISRAKIHVARSATCETNELRMAVCRSSIAFPECFSQYCS